jgi:hypothetical protein
MLLNNEKFLPSADGIQHTGDWAKDCDTGRALAENIVAQCAEDPQNYPKFLTIARNMTTRGLWGGVEVGFMQRVAELAVSGLDANN